MPVANFGRGQAIVGDANADGPPSWLCLEITVLYLFIVVNNHIVIAATSIGSIAKK